MCVLILKLSTIDVGHIKRTLFHMFVMILTYCSYEIYMKHTHHIFLIFSYSYTTCTAIHRYHIVVFFYFEINNFLLMFFFTFVNVKQNFLIKNTHAFRFQSMCKHQPIETKNYQCLAKLKFFSIITPQYSFLCLNKSMLKYYIYVQLFIPSTE